MYSNINLIFGGLMLLTFSIACNPKIIKNVNLEDEISCSIEMDKNIFTKEEEISFYFVIWNQSNQEIFIDNSPYGYYLNGKKEGGFDVRVKKGTGTYLKPIIDKISFHSGRYGITKISPNKTCEIRLSLADYVDVNEVGNYEIIINKELNVYLDRRRKTRVSDVKSYSKVIEIMKKTSANIEIVATEN